PRRSAPGEWAPGPPPARPPAPRLAALVGSARPPATSASARSARTDRAVNTGLANLAVPGDELDAAVRDLAAALLAAPRDAVIETKALLRGALDRTYEEQRAAERAAQGRRLRDLAGLGD